ncbi:hypothetical protein RhiJN_26317 [Ceratobasidium sp. AG-Ba]|nr:hypothetical protein RhiJN_26317 [Ceratobasidium sp. AG-Ba]
MIPSPLTHAPLCLRLVLNGPILAIDHARRLRLEPCNHWAPPTHRSPVLVQAPERNSDRPANGAVDSNHRSPLPDRTNAREHLLEPWSEPITTTATQSPYKPRVVAGVHAARRPPPLPFPPPAPAIQCAGVSPARLHSMTVPAAATNVHHPVLFIRAAAREPPFERLDCSTTTMAARPIHAPCVVARVPAAAPQPTHAPTRPPLAHPSERAEPLPTRSVFATGLTVTTAHVPLGERMDLIAARPVYNAPAHCEAPAGSNQSAATSANFDPRRSCDAPAPLPTSRTGHAPAPLAPPAIPWRTRPRWAAPSLRAPPSTCGAHRRRRTRRGLRPRRISTDRADSVHGAARGGVVPPLFAPRNYPRLLTMRHMRTTPLVRSVVPTDTQSTWHRLDLHVTPAAQQWRAVSRMDSRLTSCICAAYRGQWTPRPSYRAGGYPSVPSVSSQAEQVYSAPPFILSF